MPAPSPNFQTARALAFDIYGTLVDWESGILPHLLPLTSQLPPSHPAHPSSPTYHDSAIAAFDAHERHHIAADPSALYEDLLIRSYNDLASEWHLQPRAEDAERVPASIKDWQAFPDTVAAMQRLSKRFKLIALSNISRDAFAKTTHGPLKDVHFDGKYLAQNIGSYKPDQRNFEYLLNNAKKDFGVEKHEVVMVAHGVESDQVPAEEIDLAHVWIRRGKNNWGETMRPKNLLWFETLGDLADYIDG